MTYKHFIATDGQSLNHPACSPCRNDIVSCLTQPPVACTYCPIQSAANIVMHTLHQHAYRGKPKAFAYCIDCAAKNMGSDAVAFYDIAKSIDEAITEEKRATAAATLKSKTSDRWWSLHLSELTDK